MNSVTSPAVRTGLQGVICEAVIRLVTVVPDPDLVVSDGDRALFLVLGTGVVSLVQNLIEKRAGVRLLAPKGA